MRTGDPSGRRLSAARRQAARYRRTLEDAVRMATDRLLEDRHDVTAYKLVELVGPVLGEKRAHGTGME